MLNFGIGMSSHVIKNLVNTFAVFGGSPMLCGNVIKGHQDGGVNGYCTVEKTAGDQSDTFFTGIIKEGTIISRCWA